MEDNFNAILIHQQELEHLKKQNCPSRKELNNLRRQTDSYYSRIVLDQCMHLYSQIQIQKFFYMLRKIPKFLFILFIWLIFALTLITAVFYHNPVQNGTSGQTASSDSIDELPIVKMQDAILAEDYEEARRIIKENGFQPDNFATVLCFSKLYVHDQEYDQAADVLINFITDVSGTQNISEYSLLYEQLKVVSELELSPDVRQRCSTCLKACQKSAAQLASISALIDTERYDVALELCDATHQNGTYYSVLFEYYNTCYTKLEKYEDYAVFLMKLAKMIQKEGDITLSLPDRFRVQHCLENIYSLVSEETQKKIDALDFL